MENKLTKVMSFRLSDDDYSKFHEKIKLSGFNKSEFFRLAVLGNKTEVIAKEIVSDDKKKLIFFANKASNNLNQLAKKVNASYLNGTLDNKLYAKVLVELSNVSRLLQLSIDHAD